MFDKQPSFIAKVAFITACIAMSRTYEGFMHYFYGILGYVSLALLVIEGIVVAYSSKDS